MGKKFQHRSTHAQKRKIAFEIGCNHIAGSRLKPRAQIIAYPHPFVRTLVVGAMEVAFGLCFPDLFISVPDSHLKLYLTAHSLYIVKNRVAGVRDADRYTAPK